MTIGVINSQTTGLNIAAINRGIANQNEAVTGKKQEEAAATAMISPSGKRQNLITQLMKQKQYLTEQMNSLSSTAQENGLSVQEQMKEFQKQMDTIDEQIAQLQTQQEEEKAKEQETPAIYEKPKTKEELESQKMKDLMSLATSSNQVETMVSSKNQLEGRMNVLASEIKTGNGNLEAKQEEITQIKAKTGELNSKIGVQLQEIVKGTEDLQQEYAETDRTEETEDGMTMETIQEASTEEDLS